MKSLSAKQVCTQFGCDTLQQVPDITFSGVATLAKASANSISFLTNSKYTSDAKTSLAGAIICSPEVATSLAEFYQGIIFSSQNAYATFAKISQYFFELRPDFSGQSSQAYIDASALVHPSATLFPFVFVGPGAVIDQNAILYPGVFVGGGSHIGENCILYPNAVVREGCILEARCILNPGAVIGGDGFGFAPCGMENIKIPQIGGVILQADVEVGSNSSIDRGAFDNTIIGEQSKIDSLVQVGHNVIMGKACFLAGQTGVAGSTSLGNRVTLGGQVGVAGHIHIGDNVTVLAQSGVSKSLTAGVYAGTPTKPAREHWKQMVLIEKLVTSNKVEKNKN